MRIKAVLRDSEILQLEPASNARIVAAAKKNADRLISFQSLLKIMGLDFDERTKMLDAVAKEKLHIWLAIDSEQHVIYISSEGLPEEMTIPSYQWQ